MDVDISDVKLRRQRRFVRSRQNVHEDDDVTSQQSFGNAPPIWRRSANLPVTFDQSVRGRTGSHDEQMCGQPLEQVSGSPMRQRGSWDGFQQHGATRNAQPEVTYGRNYTPNPPPGNVGNRENWSSYQTSAAIRATPAPAPWRQLPTRPQSQIITSSPYLPWQAPVSRSFEEDGDLLQKGLVQDSNATSISVAPIPSERFERHTEPSALVINEFPEAEAPISKEIEYIPPAPHVVNKLEDRELASRVATLNSRESKKKQLIAKLAAIRNELTSRISSFDSKEAPDASTALQLPSDPGRPVQQQTPTATSASPAQNTQQDVSNQQDAVSSNNMRSSRKVQQAMAKRTSRREMIKRAQTLPLALTSNEPQVEMEHEREPRPELRVEHAQLTSINNTTPRADRILSSPFATTYSPLPSRRVEAKPIISQTPVTHTEQTSLQVLTPDDSHVDRSPRMSRRNKEVRAHGALSLVNTIQARLANKAKTNSLESTLLRVAASNESFFRVN